MAYSKKTKEKFASYEKEIEDLKIELQDFMIKHKYCLFDLEATRRERDYLKKIVDGK